MRSSFAYVSWHMFLDRPIFGFGFGQFPMAKCAYLADRTTDLDLESIREYVHHNTFLSVLTETGLVGLALYLAILAGWAAPLGTWCSTTSPAWVRAHGMLLLAVLAVYACQGLFHELSYTPIDHSLVFLLAGVGVGLDRQRLPLGSRALSFGSVLGQGRGASVASPAG